MHSKTLVVASVVAVVLVAGVTWLWTAPESRRNLSEAEQLAGSVTGRTGSPHEQPPAAERERAGTAPSMRDVHSNQSRSLETGSASEVAQARSDVALRQGEGEVREGLDTRAGFAGFKELVAALSALSKGKAGVAPIDVDAVGVNENEVAQLDLDGDRAVAPWEVRMAEKLTQRAEKHPVKNDLDDGAYPIDREDYGRPDWEFEEIDTNGDGDMDVDEYYAFLADTERVLVRLDINEDRAVSFEESGLPADEFAALDRDDSGDLKPWELRQAQALGTWD